MKHDVIIPMWNNGDMTATCLLSLRGDGSYSDYRVILIDNGSDPGELSKLETALDLTKNYLVIKNTENLGFVKATNQGLLAATAKYVTLLNNDAQVENEFFQQMEWSINLYQSKRVGAVGPVSDAPGQAQSRYPQTKSPFVSVLPYGSMLSFFCCMIRAEALDEVGLLDEEFGVGFGDDDDYCNRLQNAGWHLALAQHVLVHHKHRTTFKQLYTDDQIKAMQERAMDLVNAKNPIYSRMPDD